ncbi:MAG: class II aldolase/adducin family protein [Syntrophales bacterium]|nr:class II aldolase/adducin family protein [Syntrophales bacterium]
MAGKGEDREETGIRAAFARFTGKLLREPLVTAETLLMGVRTADGGMVWHGGDEEERNVLAAVMTHLERRSVILAMPAEPYGTMVEALGSAAPGVVYPKDFETRVFLTDLPVAKGDGVDDLCRALTGRRAAIVPGRGVITAVKGDLAMAYILYCAVCFACFVKFCGDLINPYEGGPARPLVWPALEQVMPVLRAAPPKLPPVKAGPFRGEAAVAACAEAGARTVQAGLVNAHFGNVSYRDGGVLFISGKGAPLDELSGRIIAVDLAVRGGAPSAVSTEYPTHRDIVLGTDYRAVLHGHPRFAVILSLACPERDRCDSRDHCHRFCPRDRSIGGVPVVSGEAGGGPLGLQRRVPPVITRCGGVIVHGHGVFTAGREDFREALALLGRIEGQCRQTVLSLLAERLRRA